MTKHVTITFPVLVSASDHYCSYAQESEEAHVINFSRVEEEPLWSREHEARASPTPPTVIDVRKCFFLFPEGIEMGFLMAQKLHHTDNSSHVLLSDAKVCIPRVSANRDQDHHGVISSF